MHVNVVLLTVIHIKIFDVINLRLTANYTVDACHAGTCHTDCRLDEVSGRNHELANVGHNRICHNLQDCNSKTTAPDQTNTSTKLNIIITINRRHLFLELVNCTGILTPKR